MLVVLAVGLLAFFLLRYIKAGMNFPIGPDSSVYLWWSRLASVEGLSVVGKRPGVPALLIATSQTLGLNPSQVLAGLGGVLGASIGLSVAAMFDEAGASRNATLLAAALSGLFASYLAGGYFANLIFVAFFLAAATLLALPAPRRPRSLAAGAVLLLATGGLSHPLFFLLGGAILLLALPFRRGMLGSVLDPRTEEGRTVMGLAGSTLVTGVGLAALLIGPAPLAVDTSLDAFLRRAGLGGALRKEYLQRMAEHWARYVLPIPFVLAWYGRKVIDHGPVRRFIRAYGFVTVVGIIVSIATGWFPVERFIAFAFVIPMASALGVERLYLRLSARRWLAVTASVVLVGAMVGGMYFTWSLQHSYINEENTFEIATAGRIAMQAPPGTPLVFLVDEASEELAAFRLTRAGNVIRASLPPELIPNVHLYFGTPTDYLANRPTVTGLPQKDALSRVYLSDLQTALKGTSQPPLVFLLRSFDYNDFYTYASQGHLVAPGVLVFGNAPSLSGAAPALDPLNPKPPWSLTLGGIETFAFLLVVGLGWSTTVCASRITGAALAVPFGMAWVLVSTIVAERLGMPLDAGWIRVLVLAICLAGYLVAWLARRKRRGERHAVPDAPIQVD
jgi:hypothetical protein